MNQGQIKLVYVNMKIVQKHARKDLFLLDTPCLTHN